MWCVLMLSGVVTLRAHVNATELTGDFYYSTPQGDTCHNISGVAFKFGVAAEFIFLVVAFYVDNSITPFCLGAFL